MKIGMLSNLPMLESLKYFFRGIDTVLGGRHETFYRPPEYMHSSKDRQAEMTRDLIRNCDVVLGPTDEMFLETRDSVSKNTPYIWFPFGSVPRGLPDLVNYWQHFKTTDLLVVNCAADLKIMRKFFDNAQLRLLPFVFDESVFYPLDETTRQAMRASLGFGAGDRILVYAGRLTLEKNVHTLLKIFRVVQDLLPNAHLVVAGQGAENPFPEFGVFPVNMRNTLVRTIHKLGLAQERLHFVGAKNADELRGLYNLADVLINLTLLHDECFGLGQVEAMACGTPVVGTNWGGLKDTIIDGESGYKISTAVTSTGVKVDWWEAACKIVSLLEGDAEGLRQRSRQHALGQFSLAPFRHIAESIISEAGAFRESNHEPLALTAFGREFWETCAPRRADLPGYRRSPRAYELYRELITPYTGATPDSTADERLSPDHILCLATPVAPNDDGSLSVDDLIFPLAIDPPGDLRGTITAVLGAMKEEPVIKVERLLGAHLSDRPDAPDALSWMLDAGLLLKTLPENGHRFPQGLGARLSTPMFSVQRLEHTVDAVMLS